MAWAAGPRPALLRQALEIFQRIGTAEAGDVSRELTALTEPGPPPGRAADGC